MAQLSELATSNGPSASSSTSSRVATRPTSTGPWRADRPWGRINHLRRPSHLWAANRPAVLRSTGSGPMPSPWSVRSSSRRSSRRVERSARPSWAWHRRVPTPGLGRQDTDPDGRPPGLLIVGASSDHLVLEAGRDGPGVGAEVRFAWVTAPAPAGDDLAVRWPAASGADDGPVTVPFVPSPAPRAGRLEPSLSDPGRGFGGLVGDALGSCWAHTSVGL